MRYIFYLLIIVSLCCSSCASSYRQINPLRVVYRDSVTSPGLAVEYKYDVLRQAGNKKYARKADDKKIKIVALKVTNHTQEEVTSERTSIFFPMINASFRWHQML